MSSSLIGILVFAVIAVAQSVKVEGPIKSRNGDTMTLQTSTSPNVAVLLTDDTKVEQVQGMLKVRRKDMSMAAFIPGLIVKVEGTYDKEKLVASSVTFKGNDLVRAKSIQAGLHETQAQAEQNKANLEKQNVALDQQQQQIIANKTAIDAAVSRFGQLDDYYIRDEATTYFDNGKTKVNPKYDFQLMELAEKAKNINTSMGT